MIVFYVYLLLNIFDNVHCNDQLEETKETEINPALEEFLPEIYNLYLHAALYDKTSMTRRFYKDSHLYLIRIEMIQDEKGMKAHQLIMKEGILPSDHPRQWIYKIQPQKALYLLKQEDFSKTLKLIQILVESNNKELRNRVSTRDDAKFKYLNAEETRNRRDIERIINANVLTRLDNMLYDK